MENFWAKAKTFAEEAAKRSQAAITNTSPAKIADIVSETAKRSKDIAVEASRKAEEFKTAAFSLADQIPALSIAANSVVSAADAPPPTDLELETFGITDDLRDFVKGLTSSTFRSFPIQDDATATDVATVSNVSQDLSEWQQKHANLVLTTVKEVSKLRYDLCPRHMKDRRFWRIYFTLVSTHVAAYERKYVEECKQQKEEQAKAEKAVELTPVSGQEVVGGKLKSKSSTASTEQDLDSFLLGDEDSDGHPGDDDDNDNFDDDFDKIDNSEIEDGK